MPEFLSTVRCFGVPNHELKLKIGTLVMLLRNIDDSMSLCNGTRMIIIKLEIHVPEVKILSRTNVRHKVMILGISLTS